MTLAEFSSPYFIMACSLVLCAGPVWAGSTPEETRAIHNYTECLVNYARKIDDQTTPIIPLANLVKSMCETEKNTEISAMEATEHFSREAKESFAAKVDTYSLREAVDAIDVERDACLTVRKSYPSFVCEKTSP